MPFKCSAEHVRPLKSNEKMYKTTRFFGLWCHLCQYQNELHRWACTAVHEGWVKVHFVFTPLVWKWHAHQSRAAKSSKITILAWCCFNYSYKTNATAAFQRDYRAWWKHKLLLKVYCKHINKYNNPISPSPSRDNECRWALWAGFCVYWN